MADATKPRASRTFVRVRPFTAEEATICPEDCPVPREVIAWDGGDVLTVLDPLSNFEPRKDGSFAVGNVLWSFKDDLAPDVVVQTQQDVYAAVVAPAMPSIVEGYNTAFCIAGSSSSGRYYTLYGDGVDSATRGLLPRFAENFFAAFNAQRRANCTLAVDLEAIDISSESYVDLLAPRRPRAATDELKLVPSPEGPRLQGATNVPLNNEAEFLAVIKQLQRTVKKRNSTHVVNLRITETFEFEDPDNAGQSVSKSRRVQVVFAMLRNMPPAFQRCVDVAVEHDSGENPLAKVPVRETAFTKLFPDLLQQGFLLNFVSCVSPFYEHVREDVNTLQFALKVKKLKGRPKLNQDASLVEMRRLVDEVRDLKTAARKQNESMLIVQQELNAREVELMKQEANYNQVAQGVENAARDAQCAAIGRKLNAEKTRYAKKSMTDQLNEQRQEIVAVQNSKLNKEELKKEILKASSESKARAAATNGKIDEERRKQERYRAQLEVHKGEVEQLNRMRKFNAASAEEQKREVLLQSTLHKPAEAELQAIQKEQKALAASDDSAKRLHNLKPDYDKVILAEAPTREKEALVKEIAQLEKEIKEVEAESARLQMEIDQKKSQCGCVLI